MRVGIDYLAAASHAPGVGRYARELVRAIVALNAPDERPDLALFDVGRAERTLAPKLLGLQIGDPHVQRVTSSMPRRFLPLLARFGRGADRWLGGVDLFHHVLRDPPPMSPGTRTRQTIALSELPEPGSEADAKLARVLAAMDGVIVFSADWARKVQSRFGVPGTRIQRVHVGCEHWRRGLAELPGSSGIPPATSVPGPSAAGDPPVVLVLGARRPARRHLAILRAVEKLRAGGLKVKLLAVGAPGPSDRELGRAIEASPARFDVELCAPAPEAEMGRLVARASVLVHLSDDEGTPVTPLECFAMGLPVVASRVPAFEEALGGLAELLDNAEAQRTPELLADAIARALASPADARVLRMRLAREFTWERCARETIAVWTRVLAGA